MILVFWIPPSSQPFSPIVSSLVLDLVGQGLAEWELAPLLQSFYRAVVGEGNGLVRVAVLVTLEVTQED